MFVFAKHTHIELSALFVSPMNANVLSQAKSHTRTAVSVKYSESGEFVASASEL